MVYCICNRQQGFMRQTNQGLKFFRIHCVMRYKLPAVHILHHCIVFLKLRSIPNPYSKAFWGNGILVNRECMGTSQVVMSKTSHMGWCETILSEVTEKNASLATGKSTPAFGWLLCWLCFVLLGYGPFERNHNTRQDGSFWLESEPQPGILGSVKILTWKHKERDCFTFSVSYKQYLCCLYPLCGV